MKDRAVIKRNPMLGDSAHGILPILGSVRQADEICHRLRCLFRKQFAGKFSSGGINNRRGLA